jgi:hypothetical protein
MEIKQIQRIARANVVNVGGIREPLLWMLDWFLA